jgi:hypothetical protein
MVVFLTPQTDSSNSRIEAGATSNTMLGLGLGLGNQSFWSMKDQSKTY